MQRNNLGLFIKGHVSSNTGRTHFKKGFTPWNKGITGNKLSLETRMKMSKSRSGDKNWNWKGDNVKYAGVHHWITNTLGQPKECNFCKTTVNRRYEWANRSGLYKRNVDDWYRLCKPCHMFYDKAKRPINLLKPKFIYG